jgi:hypothetical protein
MQPNAGIPRIGAINRSHPLARGIVDAWLGLPGLCGGSRAFSVTGKDYGTLANGASWQGLSPSGLASLRVGNSTTGSIESSNPGNHSGANGTFSAWVRKVDATSPSTDYLFFAQNGSTRIFAEVETYQPGGTPRITAAFGASGFASSPVIDLDRWYFVTLTWLDGDSLRLYVDGSQVASAGSFTDQGTPTSWTVGNYFPGNSFSFGGNIADVMSWIRALSATEVATLYRESRGGYPSLLNRTRVPVGRVAAATSSKLLLRLASEGLFVGSHY